MAKRATPQPRKEPLRTVPRKPAAAAAPKKPPETNAADLEAFHYHKGCILRAQEAVEMVKKTLKTERRRASDAGINLGDLDFALKMREEEPETVQATIRRIAQYASWMGLAPGIQADLFEAADEAADLQKVAEQEGYVDGLEGKTPEGDRYDIANPVGQSRLDGWYRGQAVVKERWLDKQEPAEPEKQQTPTDESETHQSEQVAAE